MLRFSTSILLLGLVACGDDSGTGGTGGTTSTNASSGSGKASSSGTGTSGSSVSGSGSSGSGTGSSGSGTGSTTATGTGTAASSSSTGDNLQFCGVDDPGGTEERCDPTTQYCTEMNGGIVASSQFGCEPIPAGCNGTASCNCIMADGCMCTLEGSMVRITCNFPG